VSRDAVERGVDSGPQSPQAGGQQCAPVLVKVRHGLMTANLRSPTSSDDEGKIRRQRDEPRYLGFRAGHRRLSGIGAVYADRPPTVTRMAGVAIRSLTDHGCHRIGALTPMGEYQRE
jgi:hypothetical protein